MHLQCSHWGPTFWSKWSKCQCDTKELVTSYVVLVRLFKFFGNICEWIKCVKIYYITEKNMFKLLCQSSIENNSPYSAKKKIKNTTLLLQDLHPHTIIKPCMELLKGQSYPTPRDPILSRTLCTYKLFNIY